METSAQRCLRLITALEDLVHQESATLAKGDWSGAVALQDRTAPLVDFLAANPPAGEDEPALRERIAAVHQRRNETSRALGQQLEQARGEIKHAHVARRRVAQIAPAYGSQTAAGRRLRAIG